MNIVEAKAIPLGFGMFGAIAIFVPLWMLRCFKHGQKQI